MADDIFLTADGSIGSRRGLPVNFQTQPASIIGGAASGGIFRGHTIQFPWNYTISETPTNVSVGTAIYIDADVTVGSGGSLVNATALLMAASTGMRAINEIDQLAEFEFAACHASEAIKRVLFGLRPGMREFEAVTLIVILGVIRQLALSPARKVRSTRAVSKLFALSTFRSKLRSKDVRGVSPRMTPWI